MPGLNVAALDNLCRHDVLGQATAAFLSRRGAKTNNSDIARRAQRQPSSGTPDVFGQAVAFFFQKPASDLPVRRESTTSFEIRRSSDRQTGSAIRHFGLAAMEWSVRQVCAPARWRTANWGLPGWRRTGPD